MALRLRCGVGATYLTAVSSELISTYLAGIERANAEKSGETTVKYIWPNTVRYIYRGKTKQQATGENPWNKRVMSHTLHQQPAIRRNYEKVEYTSYIHCVQSRLLSALEGGFCLFAL